MSEQVDKKDLRISGNNAREIIVNVKNLVAAKYRNVPLWSLVADITGHGSGYSIEVCKSANLDPHQLITARGLIALEKKPDEIK